MSDPLDTAWRILKEPAEFNTPAAEMGGGGVQSVYTPGQGMYVQSGPVGFNIGSGSRKKPQNRTDSWGSRYGRSVAENVQAGGEASKWFQPRGEGKYFSGATNNELAALAARGIGHAADVGSMVASLPFAALGFNEGQQSGSFNTALDSTLAGYGRGRAMTNLGSRVMHGMSDKIQDSQDAYDQSMAAHEKAQQEAAEAAAEAAAAAPEAEQNTSQIGDMLTAGGYDPILAQNPTVQAALVNQMMMNPPNAGVVDASHGTDATATAATDAAENNQKTESLEQHDPDPMDTLVPQEQQSGGIAPDGSLGGDTVMPPEFSTMYNDPDFFERSEPMDLAWRMLKGV